MKYNNVDIILCKKLHSYEPIYQELFIDRVTSVEGIEFTQDLYLKMIKAFITNKKLLDAASVDFVPESVIQAFRNILNSPQIILKDIEEMNAVLRTNEFELNVVGRLDLSAPVELDSSYDARTYLINNFRDNSLGISNLYQGYSKIAVDEEGVGTVPMFAIEYLDIFNLELNKLDDFDLLGSKTTFELLSSKHLLESYNDSKMLEFVANYGMKYMYIIK